MTIETKSPTSNSGTWHDPDNAHTDNLAYAYCGSGEGGLIHDYEGYGFASAGMINEVRVDVKGYSGDDTKHSTNVYVWDGTQWQLVGTITSETECFAHQFDATSYINTPEKLNGIKTRIESVGLSAGAVAGRFVRVCWIPVYADYTPTYNVHLESKQDNEATSNLGKITFDTVEYTLPDDVSKAVGDYEAKYASDSGYEFHSWEVTDGVSVSNNTANPTTVTVAAAGTLRAVYSEITVGPTETIVAKTFPMVYLAKPPAAAALMSKAEGGTFTEISKTFPRIYIKGGKATQLQSKWIVAAYLELEIMVSDPDGGRGTHPAIVLTDGVHVTVRFEIPIPDNFASLTKAEIIIIPAASGNMRWSVNTQFGKIGAGELYNQHTGNIAENDVAVVLDNIESIDVSAAFTGLAADDIVGFEFTRHGAHANDTVDANCYLIGFRLKYEKS